MKRTKEQVAREIEKFLSGTGGAYDWDDFTTFSIDDPELEKIRVFCADLPDLYPSSQCRQCCNQDGMDQLVKIVSDLRKL